MMMAPIVPAALASSGHGPVSLNQILRAVRTHLGMEVGFISEFVGDQRVFRHVETAEGSRCIAPGGSDPLEESYCYWICEGKLSPLICDPADHPLTRGLPATEALPVGAHLSVPIRLRDGRTYGTFCCFSFAPDRSLTERDLATMQAFAQVAAEQIQEALDNGRARETKTAKIREILRTGAAQMVFQPAFTLDPQRLAFVEALARFQTKPYQSPDRWFATAAEVGLGQELELLAVKSALAQLSALPEPTALSINVSPETIQSAEFMSLLEAAPLRRLIIEITEHETVARYAILNRALEPFRIRGMRVAVDDMGAGYSSLRHILQISPDLIKLDITIVQGIDSDPARRALASALLGFAREIGCELVAEGVETEAELKMLGSLGVNIVQGFVLGRPKTLSEQSELLRSAA